MTETTSKLKYQTETVYNPETKLPESQIHTLNGEMEDLPDGSPAETYFDEHGHIKKMIWRSEGTQHREPGQGPAIVWIKNGIRVLEHYKQHGHSSRSRTKPAYIQRDAETGEVTRVSYYLDGQRLRAPKSPTLAPNI